MGWLENIENRRKRQQEEDKQQAEEAYRIVKNYFSKRRTIICPGVAILIVENVVDQMAMKLAPLIGLSKLFTSEEKASQEERDEKIKLAEHDQKIIEVLSPLLKANPKANLAEYEKPLGITIIKVDLIQPPKREQEPTDELPIGEPYPLYPPEK
jgi:hypothetical protein